MVVAGGGGKVIERPVVRQANHFRAERRLHRVIVGVPGSGHPRPVLAQDVFRVGLHRGRHVGREGPRRGGPDDQFLAGTLPEREAHIDRGVGLLPVDVRLGQLVLRHRRPAPGAPLGGSVPLVEPAALVHDSEEPPDVLDVRVGERVVVVPPVHPLPENLAPAGQLGCRPDDLLPALAGELGQAIGLDLLLRVQAELPFHADLDPEALAVEPVLVALVEAAHGTVALERVLQGPPPRGMDG
jgi:hypothetical protein